MLKRILKYALILVLLWLIYYIVFSGADQAKPDYKEPVKVHATD